MIEQILLLHWTKGAKSDMQRHIGGLNAPLLNLF